jgi:uncharacterized membrane protein YkgB
MNKTTIYFSRFAIFTIYFWFGLLKVIGESPATPLVKALFENTIAKYASFITFDQFIIAFGVFEMFIGLLFLIPRFTKFAMWVLGLHIITTALPLLVLPAFIWTKSWVPTLEGQYIIKNLAIIAIALNLKRNYI